MSPIDVPSAAERSVSPTPGEQLRRLIPIRIRFTKLLPFIVIFVMPLIAAYAQWALFGLPAVPASQHFTAETATQPYGFAAWIRITHYVNLLFMVLLIRSGLQILMDHPRLYWNVHCAPGSEWIRFTPVQVPLSRIIHRALPIREWLVDRRVGGATDPIFSGSAQTTPFPPWVESGCRTVMEKR